MSQKSGLSKLKLLKLSILGSLIFSTGLIVANIDKVTHFFSSASPEPVKAFPTAEGFGANTLGGRFGKVILVTNLNDTGAGSLRACVESASPRTCIFRTGGTITLTSPISINNPFLTIAGQTAPGGGITVRKASGGDIFSPKTHDLVFRYLTMRPGPGGENHAVQFASNSSALYNLVVDHNSISWGVDSNIETWYRVYDTTIQWSIISEGLNCSSHSKGCHSKGLMIGGYKASENSTAKGSENISILNNLLAHNADRNPLMQLCGIAQVINNTTYNPLYTFSHQQLNCLSGESYVNWVNNYHKKGPSSTSSTDLKIIPADNGTWYPGKFYVSGNIGPSRPNLTDADSKWVEVKTGGPAITTVPAPAPAMQLTTALEAHNRLLSPSGVGNSQALDCQGNWYPRRDAIDTRVVNDVINKTGKIINSPADTPEKGWVTIDPGIACADTDQDGLFDDWETRYFHSLSRGNPNTTTDDYDNDGYSDLEEFLNGTDPSNGSPIPPASPSPLPSPTSSPTPTISPSPSQSPSPTPRPSPSVVTNSYTLLPIADTSVKASSPNSNYGTKSTLYVDNNAEELVYLKFAIPSAVPSALTNASISLYVVNPASSTSTQYVSSVYDINWSERQMTYSNRPLLGDILAISHGSNSKRYLQYDVTNYVRDNVGTTISFAINSPDDDGIDFSSRESYWQSQPQLILQLQP